MALIECDECGTTVSSKAPACPKCGNPIAQASVAAYRPAITEPAPVPPRAKRIGVERVMIGVVIGLIGVFILISALTGGSSESAPSQAAGSSTSGSTSAGSSTTHNAPAAQAATYTPPPAPPKVIEISAPQLFVEYKANEVLADTKYKGQWLYVSGMVGEIGKDFTDDPYVNLLTSDNEYETVRANFAKSSVAQLAQLHKGDRISVMCRGKGMLIGSPILDCTSDDTPPHPHHAQASATQTAAQSTADTSGAQDAAMAAVQAAAASDAASAAAAATAPTLTTSFDCSKARSDAEHAICTDPELAAADVELAAIYAKAKSAASDQAAFREHVRQQWNDREKKCHDRDCLVRWYASQKEWFSGILNSTGGSGSDSQTQTSSNDATAFAGYAEKVQRRVRPNIVWSGASAGLETEIAVRCARSGTLLSATVSRPSGNDQWDQAALLAVQRADPMPVGTNGRAPGEFTIAMRPSGK
jgi:TonB family protein